MKRHNFKIHELFYIFVSILFVVYSILEIAGLTHLIEKDIQLHIIFCLICLLFIYLVLERPSINYIKNLLTNDKAQIMELLLNDLDNELKEIFNDDLEMNLEFYKDATLHKTINIKDKQKFSHYYLVSLKRYPKAKLYATSLPSKKYFWANDFKVNSVEKAMADFISNGGKVSRIFLLNSEDDIENAEIREVLEFQKNQLGVSVYTALINEVPTKYKEHFFVTVEKGKSKFAWLVRANHQGEACDFKFTINDKLIAEYKNAYMTIQKSPNFKKY